jgi:secreted trypsin-like serine protease
MRIVGGSVVELNEYPWQAAIVRKGETEPFCGATLINQGRYSPIFLQFFYLFSIFFLNCF